MSAEARTEFSSPQSLCGSSPPKEWRSLVCTQFDIVTIIIKFMRLWVYFAHERINCVGSKVLCVREALIRKGVATGIFCSKIFF